MSYGLPKADCESTTPSQQRHFNAGGDIINNGWITSAVQTFGLSVEPFGTSHPQVGSTFLEKIPCEESHSDLSLISQDTDLHTWERWKQICSQGREEMEAQPKNV